MMLNVDEACPDGNEFGSLGITNWRTLLNVSKGLCSTMTNFKHNVIPADNRRANKHNFVILKYFSFLKYLVMSKQIMQSMSNPANPPKFVNIGIMTSNTGFWRL